MLSQLSKELHAPARKNFPRRRVITLGIDDLHQADLIEMVPKRNPTKTARLNKGYKYILTVIDTFSKFAWAIPLKTKSAAEVTTAMSKIYQTGRVPRLLQSDQGLEFFNSTFQALVKKYKITHYNTQSKLKASIVERFNRTLKERLFKEYVKQNTNVWIDLLDDVVRDYNDSKHRTIGMKPIDVNKKTEGLVLERLETIKQSIFKPKFKVGDIVRISKNKKIFDKGYTGNWTEEVFRVVKRKNTTPFVYVLEDTLGDRVLGTFYEYEIKKTKIPDFARVEKVLERKGNKIKVRWLGYDPKFDSWIDASQSEKL